jgi:hypothetical protein
MRPRPFAAHATPVPRTRNGLRGRDATLAVLLAFALAAPAQDAPIRKGPKGQTWEQDEFEERTISAATTRAIKAADTEASRWLKEMSKAFPDRATAAPANEDALDKWFDLLANGGKAWRRDECPNRQVAELFDRVTGRLELGPVPAVTRDEFSRFGRKLLIRPREAAKPGDSSADADRVFRVLDRDASGVLETNEWTDRHKADARKLDSDGDREVSAAEYRAYFETRVTDSVEASAKATKTAAAATAPGKAGLPGWFKELDSDADGQVDLAEWRAGGKAIAEFQEYDLDGDGLLPPEEYQRYARMARTTPEKKNDTVSTPVGPRQKRPE